MDDDLYDEFGNYLGSDASSDDEAVSAALPHATPAPMDTAGEETGSPAGPAPEPGPMAVVLHEDKRYYPEASEVFGPDVEVLVEDQDTQPLDQPTIAPVKEAAWTAMEKEPPALVYKPSYMTYLMDSPALVRSVAVLGHLHHGKTSMVDTLVEATQQQPWALNKVHRWTDNRLDEIERGLSIKSAAVTLLLPNTAGKSYLVHAIDVPGHPQFSDETACALRLVDGAVLVVDAVEGVLMQTELAIRAAVTAHIPISLVISKIDRLIVELKLPPSDAYFKLLHTITAVNSAIIESGGTDADVVSPHLGNVCFASGLHGYVFSLRSFARVYAERQDTSLDATTLAQRLWGDVYYDAQRHRFVSKRKAPAGTPRSFVQFVLDPLYKLYSAVLSQEPAHLLATLEPLQIHLSARECKLDVKPLLQLVTRRFFLHRCSGFVDMLQQHVPAPGSPSMAPAVRAALHVPAGDDANMVDAAIAARSSGPLLVHVTKLWHQASGEAFDAYARVVSGTLRPGDRVRVLSEAYQPDDDESYRHAEITALAVAETRYSIPVNQIPAGNLVLIQGVSDAMLSQTATIVAASAPDAVPVYRPLHYTGARAVVKVAIEPLNPSELPRMLAGLRSLSKAYPMLQTRVELSGEHTLLGTGELYLDCALRDLREIYAGIELKVSDPIVVFAETCVETSSIACKAATLNHKNKLTMIAEPMERGLSADIEAGLLSADRPVRERSALLRKRYGWDALAARSIWAFGPESDGGANVLLDDTIPEDVEKTRLAAVRPSIVQGFQWGTREGPLCDEPIRNVKFKLVDALIDEAPLARAPGLIIPTARRVSYSAFLVAQPRMMEPVLRVEVSTPADCVKSVFDVLARRRGAVVRDVPVPGSPMYTVHALLPALDSFGFETDLRAYTQGMAFSTAMFDHWAVMPGDPLDTGLTFRPLEPSPPSHLARECMLKTRKRKGLSADVSVQRFFDPDSLAEATAADANLASLV